jgi:hypothetical protein
MKDDVKISLKQSGSLRTIYRWSTDRCSNDHIPDSPVRAFRRADGQLAIISAHYENWILIGSSIDNMRPVCKSILSTSNYQPKGFAKLWIQGTYTLDGHRIHALISQDFTSKIKAGGCVSHEQPGRCWLNNIVSAKSNNMGESFVPTSEPVRNVVATLLSEYPAHAQGRLGVFTTSNIIFFNGYYYFFAWTQPDNGGLNGNCLLRTDNIEDQRSWRAWDGKDFAVDLSLPDSNTKCLIVGMHKINNEIRSINWSTRAKRWIAVFSGRKMTANEGRPITGFYFSSSTDLINWSDTQLIMKAPTKPREEQLTEFYSYPSLLDPRSHSRNFETFDHDDLILTFTVQHLAKGMGTMNRDLAYVPVRIYLD